MTTMAFLLLELSPLLMFEYDFVSAVFQIETILIIFDLQVTLIASTMFQDNGRGSHL